MAAVAELEAGLIGERTKNALAAAKKRIARTGQRSRPDIKRLGNPAVPPGDVAEKNATMMIGHGVIVVWIGGPANA